MGKFSYTENNDPVHRTDSKHLEVDESSRQRTEEITEAILKLIERSIGEIRQQQKQLVLDADSRLTEFENDFKTRTEENVAQLEKEKIKLIDKLEQELCARQKLIVEAAFKHMGHIIEQAVTLGQEDASPRLPSISTTVMITEESADSEAVVDKKTTPNESSKSSCSS
ncbi:unnamed protein product [Rotaria sordida]|uniref:Uncharacterized protein n=1 Tax=Rotaria sordida TaxID=392033 RepID=A0A815IUM3_9BILA|nr:unnamed protein product [Rotaria sordida]CAF1373644.1 unnamed protein product [Rotaria sordida]CAF1489425.1 unnamed protein product [Rotaria sordida]